MLHSDVQATAGLDPRRVFARPGSPQFPERLGGHLYWIQSLPDEGGRLVLKCQPPGEAAFTVTEASYNIRSKVHEYGGRCHVLANEHCLFVNFGDQRMYQQPLSGGPAVALTAVAERGEPAWMLADPALHPDGRWLVAVGERPRADAENENAVLVLDLAAGAEERRWQVLASGHDFYAAPRFSPVGDRLCLLCWEHPYMPWDNARLDEGSFDATTGQLSAVQRIAGGDGSAACQNGYGDHGRLVFVLDSDQHSDGEWQGYWNLHQCRHQVVSAMTRDTAEYGAAHWVFGHDRVRPVDAGRVLAVRSAVQGDSLVVVDEQGKIITIDTDDEFIEFSQLSPVSASEVLLMASSRYREASIIAVDLEQLQASTVREGEAPMPVGQVTPASAIQVATRDGATTHAWHYAAAPGSPLMVLVHGGPTSRAGAAFDPLRQFWASRNFSVLDVNHRGSTGYGRAYRQALNGHWGLRDVDDVIDAVASLVQSGQADPARVIIRGGSAGGYAVLAALTRYPDVFAAGACYYGIGNLVTLAKSTHKFEARYLDSLLGEPWHPSLEGQRDSVYYQRSPIHAIDVVKSPMILFQGSEDKVVPPAVSREVVAALESAGVMHRYVEYPGEGHGFRAAENRIDALTSEAEFYEEVVRQQVVD